MCWRCFTRKVKKLCCVTEDDVSSFNQPMHTVAWFDATSTRSGHVLDLSQHLYQGKRESNRTVGNLYHELSLAGPTGTDHDLRNQTTIYPGTLESQGQYQLPPLSHRPCFLVYSLGLVVCEGEHEPNVSTNGHVHR